MEEHFSGKIRIWYSKLGFTTPEDKWINDNYEQYRKEMERSCEAFAPLLENVRGMKWFDKKSKAARDDFMIWRIICAGRWARIFNVGMV